jgi:hypothetical protein
MRSAIDALANNVYEYSSGVLLIALIATSILNESLTPAPHLLLISAISWTLVWAYNGLRVGFSIGLENVTRKRLSWAAGVFLALSQIAQRAASDKQGISWSQCLLPISVYTLTEANVLFGASPSSLRNDQLDSDYNVQYGSPKILAIATAAAAVALNATFVTPDGAVLGICSTLLFAFGLIAWRNAVHSAYDEKNNSRGGYVMANGSFSRRDSSSSIPQDNPSTCLRDAAGILALSCGTASFLIENFRHDAILYNSHLDRLGGNWQIVQNSWLKIQIVITIGVSAIQYHLVFSMVSSQRWTNYNAFFSCEQALNYGIGAPSRTTAEFFGSVGIISVNKSAE